MKRHFKYTYYLTFSFHSSQVTYKHSLHGQTYMYLFSHYYVVLSQYNIYIRLKICIKNVKYNFTNLMAVAEVATTTSMKN